MKLTEMKLTEFCAALASKEPAPGGGSASANMAAMGAGLLAMVANLTIGKKKYAQHQELMEEIAKEADSLRLRLMDAVDRDAEAYNGVSAVFSMPKETDAEKDARTAAMQAALKAATRVPYEVMQLCRDALTLAARAVGKANTNAASDLGVAAHSLLAATHGAWMNVLINLGGIKDAEFVTAKMAGGVEIVAAAESAAKDIIVHVMSEISQ
ncbi:MAG: cyclodeaminase/cyclohydrolase family protein [Clostridiales bacterium]|jgi:formiminotetrahydrofolate cyclodeaminase|nr:cyclodeaminase/cyclohydrolase family protein [Clostridiales bacterium]